MKTLLRRLTAVLLLVGPFQHAALSQVPPFLLIRLVEGQPPAQEAFGGSHITLEVIRGGNPLPAGVVELEFAPGVGPPGAHSATPGVDFTATPQRLEFAEGETSRLAELQILDDGELEEDEFVTVQGTLAVSDTRVTTSLTIAISDNEAPTHLVAKGPPHPPLAHIDGPFKLGFFPDGRKVVFSAQGFGHFAEERFNHVNGIPRLGVARLKADDSLDETFVPEMPALSERFSELVTLAPLRSGAVLLVLSEGRFEGSEWQLARLREDGSRDKTFRQVPGRWAEPFPPQVSEAPDGTLWVAGGDREYRNLRRLSAAGELISSNAWTSESFDPSEIEFHDERLRGVLPDGRLIFGDTSSRLFRLNARMERDTSFPSLFLHSHGAAGIPRRSIPGRPDQVVAWIAGVNGVPLVPGPQALRLTDLPATSLHLIPQVWMWWTDNPIERQWIHASEAWVQDTNTTHFRITFRRLGPSTGPATVHYLTRDATATAGEDYEPQSGTISFAPQEVEKAVLIPVLPGFASEPVEEFELVITSASGLAELPAPLRLKIRNEGWIRARLRHIRRLDDGRVLLAGDPEEAAAIEYSDDLKHWQPLASSPGWIDHWSPRLAIWLDASATNAPTRFYRAVAP